MKPLAAAILVASLGLNAALTFAAFTGRARVANELAAQAAATAAAANRTAQAPAPASVDPETWTKLQSEDLSALVTRLREAGFPKDVIRAMLSGLLSEQFAARRRALDPNAANRPYWKDIAPDMKLQLAQYQLYREQEKALRALLGPEARNTDPLSVARQQARFGNLSPEKMEAAQLIMEEYDQKRTELYYNKGAMTTADMVPIDRDLRSALSGVLSPAELEDYDLRNSNTGRSMRSDLAAFNPTEEEFRAIYKLRQPFDEQYNYNTGIPSPQDMQRRNEAQKQLNIQIASAIGPARAAEYERTTDYNYQRTSQLVARLDLPAETTVNLWNTQKEFEQRRSELYSQGSSASSEERNQKLTVLQQEAIAKITPILGNASRVEAYKQYGGQWLQNLAPRPRPTP